MVCVPSYKRLPILLYSVILITVYMVKREPTSINVDPELWKDAKIEAIKRGITVTDLFEQSLRKELARFSMKEKRKRGEEEI
jgi:hypothetical protein